MRDDEPVSGGDELESRIDAALRNYAEPPELTEPRVALARMMEQARAERPDQSVAWWSWGVGVAACLLALIAALGVMRTPPVPEIAWKPPAPGVVGAPVYPSDSVTGRSSVLDEHRTSYAGHPFARRELVASRTSLPKLDVFPTPAPLSPQEQALVDFAKHGPPEVQRAVLEDQKNWDAPIIVAEIQEKQLQPRSQQDR